MYKTVIEFITALGAIGTFVGMIIGAAKMLKVARFKSEKLYGKEAVERYELLRKNISEPVPNAFGPDEYQGGAKATPQLEIDRICFDRQTMPPEWKKLSKSIHYYYEEDGKIMVRGWRF